MKVEKWTDPVLGSVEVQFKSIKNIYIAVLPPDGRVRISAPTGTPPAVLRSLLDERRSWVLQKRAQLAKRPHPNEMQFVSGETFLHFGEKYTLLVQTGRRFSLSLDQGTAHLTVRAGAERAQTAAFVLKWQRDRLRREIEQRLPVWQARTGLSCSSWHIKNMKTRWGTCNTSAGRLWFNLKLVEKPSACLDYVLLHELAHLRYPNHGKAFWAFIQSFMPQYREVQAVLNGRTAG